MSDENFDIPLREPIGFDILLDFGGAGPTPPSPTVDMFMIWLVDDDEN